MSASSIVIVTALLVVIPCAMLGTLLILRQMSMMGDAISHAVLPGIVLAFFLSESLGAVTSVIGAAVFGILTAVLVEALRNTGRVKEDSAIGIVFTALFALGVFLISRYAGSVHLDLQHVLYGEIAFSALNPLVIGGASLGPRSFWTLGAVTIIVAAFVALFYKELKISTFDAGLAAAAGFSPILIHYLLMGVVSITVVGAFDSIGAILVVAFLIAPAATAYLLTERLSRMMALAVIVGAGASVSGYYLAYAFDVSISGMMAAMCGVFFLLALMFSPSHGLVAGVLRRRRNREVFALGLLVSRVGERTTEDDLNHDLGWDEGRVSKILEGANRNGLLLRQPSGEVSLTVRGREYAAGMETPR